MLSLQQLLCVLLWNNPIHCENVLLPLLIKSLLAGSQAGDLGGTTKLKDAGMRKGEVTGDSSRYRGSRCVENEIASQGMVVALAFNPSTQEGSGRQTSVSSGPAWCTE